MSDYRLEPETRFPEFELTETPGFVRGELLEVPMPFGPENEPSQLRQRAIRRHNTRRVIARRLAELIRQGFRIDEWVMKRTRGHNRRDSDERRWLQRRAERREARSTPAPDVAPHRRKRVGSRRDKAERPWSVRMVWRHYGGTSRYRSTFRTEAAARESAAARMSHGWYVGAIIERWDGKRWVRVDG